MRCRQQYSEYSKIGFTSYRRIAADEDEDEEEADEYEGEDDNE